MDKNKIHELLESLLGKENVKEKESMAKHTSLRVGGNADFFVTIDSVEKLKEFLELKIEEPITVIGNGSNILVKDSGIRGIVIKYTASNYKITEDNGDFVIEVDSGLTNGKLAYALLNEEITGFEFAAGIPGTIGGAIFMNAGAYGKEMKDIITNVTYLDLTDNTIHTINNEKCNFSYRKSCFMDMKVIILKANILLHKGNKAEIKKTMDDNLKKRIETQPVEYPNAGSTFKRGDGFITAKLIDEAGLKGTKIGGAEVSLKHAGFIINSGNATAEDILNLVKYVQEKVYEKFNKKIELEVRILE